MMMALYCNVLCGARGCAVGVSEQSEIQPVAGFTEVLDDTRKRWW